MRLDCMRLESLETEHQEQRNFPCPGIHRAMNMGTGVYHVQRTGFSRKNKDEVVGIFLEYFTVASTREKRYQIHSYPNKTFSMRGFYTIGFSNNHLHTHCRFLSRLRYGRIRMEYLPWS